MKFEKNDYAPVLSLVALIAAILCAFLAGCTPAPARVICPPLVNYTQQEQQEAANELATHPELRTLRTFMTDYGNERGECRSLDKKKAD